MTWIKQRHTFLDRGYVLQSMEGEKKLYLCLFVGRGKLRLPNIVFFTPPTEWPQMNAMYCVKSGEELDYGLA
jgi:hypothetical protein